MKKFGLLALLAIIGVVAYFVLYSKKSKPHGDEVKLQPEAVSKYSPAFNNSMNGVLTSYFALSEAFVNWDTANVRTRTALLQERLAAMQLDEIRSDTVIFQTAQDYKTTLSAELENIRAATDIMAARRSLNTFSQNFYDLLRTVRYDGGTVFLQECPMAFNDTESGLWLSDSSAIRNPYLGLYHPRYKKGMLECGEIKDSLHFAPQTQN